MGFNPPVPQQDSNWEIRVTVLLSLLFQVILIFAGPVRRRSGSALTRFLTWSCYLLADWVADLALGLLLNNMGNIGGTSAGHLARRASSNSSSNSGGSSPIIFAFWAPFLLLHLGGPDTITAYSLEDNELWLRHLLGLIFEMSAVATVFFCSLQGNPMIGSTVLMFVAGVIKYGERSYSLYNGSTDGFPALILDDVNILSYNYFKLMQVYSSKKKAGLPAEIVTIGHSGEALRDLESGRRAEQVIAHDLFLIFRAIFVKGVVSTRNRKMSEAFFLRQAHNPAKAFKILEMELGYIYDMIYTKISVLRTTAGYVLRLVACCCVIASLVIFAVHDKAGMLALDIGITYALLVSAVALDVVAITMLIFSDWTLVFLHESKYTRSRILAWLATASRCWRPTRLWSGKVSQMNLIEHARTMCGRNQGGCGGGTGARRPGLLAKVAAKLPIWVILDQNRPGFSDNTNPVLRFIFHRIKETVTTQRTTEDRKKACELRGEGALRELSTIEGVSFSAIIFKCLEDRDFDESMLLWHVATELCFSVDSRSAATEGMRAISKCLSDYMLYLLLKKPEIMSATLGIGQLRYTYTCEAVRLILQDTGTSGVVSHDDACSFLRSMDTTAFTEAELIEGDRTKTVLVNACILARELQALDDRKWLAMAMVWVEMLTYTAAMTQPREHLRLLSQGGELITIVWFLMAHMGMTSKMFEVQGTDTLAKLIVHDH